eukprot:CAMPEP_0170543636 /NCGR_PEP_ID=MMETSP0211-20121228/2686_1 /TAXON_ID=311385 /ORGANISM="Pseudokeronopsis sp., Strain OXSARD2" /LENGTH=62 /DNA_ID=CAMNT_0010847063 /DNA_START=797 /DNA_END=985 /DNA_ORIENTATION=+
MSKQAISVILDKKIRMADDEGRKAEKDFGKGQISKKEFLEIYQEKRKDFHKYQILKVKVMQA